MGSLGGTRLVALLAVALLLLGGCTGDGDEPPRPDASGSPVPSPTGTPELTVLGLGFDLPTGWRTFDVERADSASETARAVAEQLGMSPRQLPERLATTELYLVWKGGAEDGFLPSIDVYPGPGGVPADEEIEQDFVRVGAEVSDVSRQDTTVGEVVVVTYTLPTRDTTIEGATVVVPHGDRIVIIAVSEVDRARADDVADTVVASLVEA